MCVRIPQWAGRGWGGKRKIKLTLPSLLKELDELFNEL